MVHCQGDAIVFVVVGVLGFAFLEDGCSSLEIVGVLNILLSNVMRWNLTKETVSFLLKRKHSWLSIIIT